MPGLFALIVISIIALLRGSYRWGWIIAFATLLFCLIAFLSHIHSHTSLRL